MEKQVEMIINIERAIHHIQNLSIQISFDNKDFKNDRAV